MITLFVMMSDTPSACGSTATIPHMGGGGGVPLTNENRIVLKTEKNLIFYKLIDHNAR
jgi:hypothetical protein